MKAHINTKTLIQSLPSSWDELPLKDYIKLTQVEIADQDPEDPLNLFTGLDNTIRVAAVLTNTPIDALEALPASIVMEMGKKLAFISEPLKPSKKGLIQWKDVESVSYDDFVTFQQLSKNPLPNLHLLIKAFSKNKLTEDEILNLSTQEAMSGFFTLRMYVRKYFKTTSRSTAWKAIRLIVQEGWTKAVTRCKRISRKQESRSNNLTDGSSLESK
ncbi:hypothetical protein [Flaviaesturariibacter amylovorans]|uniref:Uncharacterized protein n=1 Tax=Flaviaesturariibacter amylovorans TaxID=1084520 RepID=A0ABP8GLB9_9BACT